MSSSRHQQSDLPLFVHWLEFVKWLFARTERFPRRVRWSVSSRIESLALDVLDWIVVARYSRNKAPVLRRINLAIERLRILLRLCNEQGFLASSAYEYAARSLVEAGRMVGGWKKAMER
ncbi:MAG: diversity-generating retroelement protein Avd [Candidatus Methanospirare jalkutatii]|nr:diversity-generating retroelement protein Avd [Candidatus Methanospirare jalkutatii]